MDHKTAKGIFIQSGSAMLDFLEAYSVGIVVFKDDTPQEIGSGTCITIGCGSKNEKTGNNTQNCHYKNRGSER